VTPPFAGIALHTWSIDTTPLGEALKAARAGGCTAVELRRIDFVRSFEAGMSNEDVLATIRASGMPVCTLGVEYGWIFATGDESRRLFGVFRETCANAVAIGCRQIMSAPGPFEGTIPEAIVNLRAAAEIAAEFGLDLAFEFNSQHAVINRVEVLREILHGAGARNAGMLLDGYHLHRSGRPGRGFEDVEGKEIFAFQYSDVSPNPVTGVKRPMDRLVPGEGVVEWTPLLTLLAEKGFSGHLSYEAPNPVHWARPPAEAVRTAVDATHNLIAAAFPGAPLKFQTSGSL
jgi:sugar phosphate isomerase/epimerase